MGTNAAEADLAWRIRASRYARVGLGAVSRRSSGSPTKPTRRYSDSAAVGGDGHSADTVLPGVREDRTDERLTHALIVTLLGYEHRLQVTGIWSAWDDRKPRR